MKFRAVVLALSAASAAALVPSSGQFAFHLNKPVADTPVRFDGHAVLRVTVASPSDWDAINAIAEVITTFVSC